MLPTINIYGASIGEYIFFWYAFPIWPRVLCNTMQTMHKQKYQDNSVSARNRNYVAKNIDWM